MAVAKIDVTGMSTLVTGIENGIETLDLSRSSLRTTLSHYHLDTTRSAALLGPADWARAELPGLRRRLALAQALEGSDPSWPTGTVQLDDVTDITSMDPDKAEQAGKEAAEALRDGDGPPDDALAAQIVEMQNDPYFAAGFAKALDGDELADVVVRLSYSRTFQDGQTTQADLDKKNAWYGPLLDGMSTTLATATRATGELALPSDYAQGWVDQITAEVPSSPYYEGGDGQTDRANALTVLLNTGRFGTPFLSDLSEQVYDYERSVGDDRGAVWGPRGGDVGTSYGVYDAAGRRFRDPLAGIMNALGNNAEAAQDFFGGGKDRTVSIDGKDVQVSDRLAYLVVDRRWDVDADNGGSLGSALEAATTELRNSGADGKMSAEIASQTFALIGDKTGDGKSGGFLGMGADDGWKMWDGLRPHVAQMLASYGADVHRVVATDQSDDVSTGWSMDGSGNLFDDDMPYGAVLDQELLDKIVGTLGEDQDDFTVFLTGMFQAGNLAVNHGLASAMSTQPNAGANFIMGLTTDGSNSSITNSSKVIGWALDTGYGGDKADEEMKKKQAEALADALSLTSSLPFIPEIKPAWLKWGVDQAKDKTLDGIKDSAPSDSGDTYTQLDDQAQQNLRDQTMNLLLRNGYLDDRSIAGAADKGVVVTPPPAAAIEWSASGDPLRFKTESPEYATWLASSGLSSILAESVVGVYRDQWGVLK